MKVDRTDIDYAVCVTRYFTQINTLAVCAHL